MANICFKGITLNGVNGISCDSRTVEKGFLFVAVRGEKFNGEEFINEAIKKGAKFILAESDSFFEKDIGEIKYIYTTELKKDLASLCCLVYNKRPENIIAITGTNGKTSTVHFVREILKNANIECTTIGTLGLVWPDGKTEVSQGTLTSPDAIQLGKILEKIKSKNINYVAMEASSHGIDQYRMFGNKFNVVAFTNFSQDHLDYHKTMDSYFNAKAKLFSEYANEDSVCILNCDIPEYKKLTEICEGKNVITYGFSDGDIFYIKADKFERGCKGEISIFNEKFSFEVNIKSRYQLNNILCAVAIAYALGIPAKKIASTLSKLDNVPGRMHGLKRDNSPYVYVDYAHTPDALKNAIYDARSTCAGKLFLVFGCGGDRDKSKRKLMGKIANELTDVVIVTDDNPRTEDPDTIRKEVISECPNAINIASRRDAIAYALENADIADCVLIAGKGHETYQIIGENKNYFSDIEEVKKILGE